MDDLDAEIESIFSDFNPVPIGSASLAQVHKATIRPGVFGPESHVVAVKIQHPTLKAQAPADIRMCARIVRTVAKWVPDFQFGWLASEMQLSLPEELDFNHEAANAVKIAKHLKGMKNVKIPEVYMSTNRILIMECKFFVKKMWMEPRLMI